MAARKKSARKAKRRMKPLLISGEVTMAPVLVTVEPGRPKSFYNVYVTRGNQDIEWWAPDATRLEIEFLGGSAPKSLKTQTLARNHKRLHKSEHQKVKTPPNAKGVEIEYVIRFRLKGKDHTIDPVVIIQP